MRKPRLHVPGAFYHVTLRGNHRQDILRIATLSQVAALFGRTEAALRQSVKLHFNYP